MISDPPNLGETIRYFAGLMVYFNEPSYEETQKICSFWKDKYEPIEDEL